jgi:hypothetical protein
LQHTAAAKGRMLRKSGGTAAACTTALNNTGPTNTDHSCTLDLDKNRNLRNI